jgi:hypothetical protein
VLLRYSGTEPKARLLLEGRDAKVLEKWSQKICGAIQKQIGGGLPALAQHRQQHRRQNRNHRQADEQFNQCKGVTRDA